MTIEEIDKRKSQICTAIQYLLRHSANKLDEGENRMIYVRSYVLEVQKNIEIYYALLQLKRDEEVKQQDEEEVKVSLCLKQS
jgi:hypothetical protein